MFRIGVISDTHNYLDPSIKGLFAGVDHILHAGDIGLTSVLLELESIAPVTAVSGNTDDPALNYNATQVITLNDRKCLLHHIVNPHDLSKDLQERIERERPDAVIFGHTHKPFSDTIHGIFYLNPGYAGKPRFGMPRTVAVLEMDGRGMRAKYFKL